VKNQRDQHPRAGSYSPALDWVSRRRGERPKPLPLPVELLGRFSEALRLAAVSGVETVADLGEQKVNSILSEHERVRYPELVAIEPGPDPLGRLDAYFRPLQEAYASQRRAQEEHFAVMAEASRKLDAEIAARDDAQFRAVWACLPPRRRHKRAELPCRVVRPPFLGADRSVGYATADPEGLGGAEGVDGVAQRPRTDYVANVCPECTSADETVADRSVQLSQARCCFRGIAIAAYGASPAPPRSPSARPLSGTRTIEAIVAITAGGRPLVGDSTSPRSTRRIRVRLLLSGIGACGQRIRAIDVDVRLSAQRKFVVRAQHDCEREQRWSDPGWGGTERRRACGVCVRRPRRRLGLPVVYCC
jgi:hypothetical protein